MTQKFDIKFIDNSATQYDQNASIIRYGDLGTSECGKLFLGDYLSASYVQLKARDVKSVVSCCSDMHRFCKESHVNYLKIDPEDGLHRSLAEGYIFIDKALKNLNNVVVYCETGNGKSASVVLYYIMRKFSITLAQAHKVLLGQRGSIRPSLKLLQLLITEEKKLFGSSSVRLEGRSLIPLSDDSIFSSIKERPGGISSTTQRRGGSAPLTLAIVVVAFFGGLYGILWFITHKH
jgi:hypothetical protein